MSVTPKETLYQQIIHVTHIYLGPAANRFIARQVKGHLHKDPEDITKSDLKKLIDWIQVAVSLLTDDSEVIEEYIFQLHKLANDSRENSKTRSAS